jgi:peptidoglycan-associated lipoprotein
MNDETEDLLRSSDPRTINDELRRQGFSDRVYFDFDDISLSDVARDQLARNAALLRSNPHLEVILEGHTDSRGTNEYNIGLGERRANAVKQYLGSMGVEEGSMQTISYGEERPVCNEEHENCWSQNRRVRMMAVQRRNG